MSKITKEEKELMSINKKIDKLTAKENKRLEKEEKQIQKELEKEEKQKEKKSKKESKVKCKTPWYSSYGNTRPHLEYPNYSMYDLLVESKNKYPENISYNYFGTKVTYEQFVNQVDEAAKSFKKIGIKQGDKVTICMPNTPEAIISFYALNKIGAISNLIHPLSSENEIKYYLNVSDSVAIITINLAVKKISNIIEETKVKYTIVVSPKDSMPTALGVGYYLTKDRKIKLPKYKRIVFSWKNFIEQGKDYLEDTYVESKGDDVAAILYSGGTSGSPKGIVLSNFNFNALAISGIEACGTIKEKDTLLAIMPIFHGFGLGIGIHTVQAFGGTSILIPQFSVNGFDKLLSKYKPNVLLGVPTLYEALLKNKKICKMDLSYIKIIISGGDSLPIGLKNRVDKFLHEHSANIQIREGYGLTECLAGTCLTPPTMYKEGSIGIPYPDVYYKIVEPNTQIEVPYGEDGEICISGPSVMMGYLNEPKETAHALQVHDDGMTWLHTGDLGSMDSQGWIFFKQRLKRMIVSSGYNLYPQHIENVLESHPYVLMSTVIGVPHPYKIQVAKAFVVLQEGIKPTEEVKESIMEHCKKNLAKYSLPHSIEYRETLPKTKLGKVAYRQLEEEEINNMNKPI